jgi:short-subunit dehydrogenase
LFSNCIQFHLILFVEQREWTTNKYEGKNDLENQTVVITGANSGIGLKLAEEVARRKAKVILACQDDDNCIQFRRRIVNETGNGKVYCSKIDLSSLESITEFVNRINTSKLRFD